MIAPRNKILLVDDSVTIVTLLKNVLQTEYEVDYKHDALVALASLKETVLPDLIITDIHMPELNGFEFVKQLKRDPLYHQIPILVLSSYNESAAKIKMLKMGVDDYVTKPFHIEELLARVKRVMARSGKELLIN